MENGAPQQEQQKMVQVKIPHPDQGVFESLGEGDVKKHLMIAPQPIFFIEKVEYPEEGGIYIYKAGGDPVMGEDGKTILTNREPFLYPEKGFPTPEACQATNTIKRMFIGQIRFLARFPFLAVFFLRTKILEKWLNEFCSVAEITLGPYFLKEERYSNFCRELRKFIKTFMDEIGIKENTNFKSKVFITLFEYDNAYTFRFQDLANETTKEKLLENPRREIKRLLSTLKERDKRASMHERFSGATLLFRFLLMVPKFKRAFRKALESIDFTKLQMDEGDRYHVLRWSDYKFLGIEDEKRHNKFIELHNGNPPKGLILQTLPIHQQIGK